MTNKYLTRLALPLLLLSAANAYGARIKSTLWEHPSVFTANDEHLQVQSVLLSDTATEVSIHVLQHNSGFTFSPRTYLLADDGKHYPIRRGKGIHLGKFMKAMETLPAVRLDRGDASYQLEVMPGYDVRLIVWEGDDEFPPNSQILFSDNFPQAFSAEDRTVVGDILISDIKRRM